MMLVAMLDSIHTARWLELLSESNFSITLFPSTPHRRLHSKISSLLREKPATFKLARLTQMERLTIYLGDLLLRGRLLAHALKKEVSSTRPTLIHALEFQHAAYSVCRAFPEGGLNHGFKFFVTNWGSDIFWFKRYPRHRRMIVDVLRIADAYSAECMRDKLLAVELGFEGKIMQVFPNSGGFDTRELPTPEELSPHKRDVIAVKGYQTWSGRALRAIFALYPIRRQLGGYRIQVFSASFSVMIVAWLTRLTGVANIHSLPKKSMSHEKVLELLRQSAVYVGVSKTDGISTSMLEAMAMGAIPVQTTTACCREWFTEKSGVPLQSPKVKDISNGIIRALHISKLIEPKLANVETVRLKADKQMIRKIAIEFYESIVAGD